MPSLNAQTLKNARPPAEVPPVSYKGKQYVDSRGCIYIRAGIDGNVTWVPRVNRSRKQICGFQPTGVQPGSTTAAAAARARAPELITLDAPATAAAKPAAAPVAKPAPKTVKVQTPRQPVTTTRKKPVPTIAGTLPRAQTGTQQVRTQPKTQVVRKPAPVAAAPVRVQPRTAAPAPSGGDCSGVSSLSQQYVNKSPDVRCGPQPEAPVSYGSGIGDQSSLRLTPNTRVVPRHVHDNRQNTQNVEVPQGYYAAWEDDRLNPRRTERGLKPAVISSVVEVPYGFRQVERGDGRLNPMRGQRSPEGDRQTAGIWTETLPRRLKPVPTQGRIITLPPEAAKSPAEESLPLIRLSTRSAPDAPRMKQAPAGRWVRVARFDDEARARQAAQSLARQGVPVRLGAMRSRGKSYKVVMAGPFTSDAQTSQALRAARNAGYTSASVSR